MISVSVRISGNIFGARHIVMLAATLIVVGLLGACGAKTITIPSGVKATSVYPGTHWRLAETPEQLGWSSAKLALARKFSKEIGSAAVMIVDDGTVVDAWGDITRDYQCHSMRKSILSALIGIHVHEGDVDLTATLEQLGIDDRDPPLTPAEKKATVGDLIRARSGVYHPALGESGLMQAMRPRRLSHAPGTFWYYNNWDFNALGTIFEQRTGTGIFDDFAQRLAQPLQMEDFDVANCRYLTWSDYKNTRYSKHPYYLFRLSARDLARFGLLFLRQGRWEDRQLIQPAWIIESTATHSAWGMESGYGYMWWTGSNRGLLPNVSLKEDGYMASGAGGHRLIVLPYRNLVVVHRVDTDAVTDRSMNHHIGRLLWMILSAAGETGIGDDPSIAATTGDRLGEADLNRLLSNGSRWVVPNHAIFTGGRHLVLTCDRNGTLIFSPARGTEFEGRWWIDGDRFRFDIIGIRAYFELVRQGDTIQLFDSTGTRFGTFDAAASRLE